VAWACRSVLSHARWTFPSLPDQPGSGGSRLISSRRSRRLRVVSSTIVEAMTLSVYDGTALQLHPDSHRLDGAFPFGALSWSRYCSECLIESQGRWQLAWRLGWSFVCLLHNCLLADARPSCGKYQRHQQVCRRVPTPTMCVCGHMLDAVETVKLPADHAILDAQRPGVGHHRRWRHIFRGIREQSKLCTRRIGCREKPGYLIRLSA
jgi:hypothetical protein